MPPRRIAVKKLLTLKLLYQASRVLGGQNLDRQATYQYVVRCVRGRNRKKLGSTLSRNIITLIYIIIQNIKVPYISI